MGGEEYGRVEVNSDGTATVRVGTSAHGQGHATSFGMIVADRLGIPLERVRFVQSDTAAVPRGGGAGGPPAPPRGRKDPPAGPGAGLRPAPGAAGAPAVGRPAPPP